MGRWAVCEGGTEGPGHLTAPAHPGRRARRDLLRTIVYPPSERTRWLPDGPSKGASRPGTRRPWRSSGDDRDRLVTLFDFPQEHRRHLRTTNVVEGRRLTASTHLLTRPRSHTAGCTTSSKRRAGRSSGMARAWRREARPRTNTASGGLSVGVESGSMSRRPQARLCRA